jgi:hypothetical protein
MSGDVCPRTGVNITRSPSSPGCVSSSAVVGAAVTPATFAVVLPSQLSSSSSAAASFPRSPRSHRLHQHTVSRLREGGSRFPADTPSPSIVRGAIGVRAPDSRDDRPPIVPEKRTPTTDCSMPKPLSLAMIQDFPGMNENVYYTGGEVCWLGPMFLICSRSTYGVSSLLNTHSLLSLSLCSLSLSLELLNSLS